MWDRAMNNKKNLISAVVYQLIHIVYGLVVPRIILLYFGSEINGLVSSITQFLSFISLLEGGLGAVVLAELYVPLETDDETIVRQILFSSQSLFHKLSLFYVCYTVVLGVIYGFSVRESFGFTFVFELTVILSLAALAEYLFSISYRLLLQADQKIYITNYVCTAVLLVNIAVALIAVRIYPEIRLLKLFSSIAFFVQPIVLSFFIPKEYRGAGLLPPEKYHLNNRWSGFAQNLAHFINMNTDIVLITIFCSYSEVSVYTVYMLAINALRMIVTSAADSYQGALGKYIAQGDPKLLHYNFDRFFVVVCGASLALFCTCLLLINPFVAIYTTDIYDVDYYQPGFALVILAANLIYCFREPFRLLILAAGKFKETNFGSIMEAVLNVGVSLVLIPIWGLTGVAIGTLTAVTYRLVYFVVYLKKSMMKLDVRRYLPSFFISVFVLGCNICIYAFCSIGVHSIPSFFVSGAAIFICECLVVLIAHAVLFKIVSKKGVRL